MYTLLCSALQHLKCVVNLQLVMNLTCTSKSRLYFMKSETLDKTFFSMIIGHTAHSITYSKLQPWVGLNASTTLNGSLHKHSVIICANCSPGIHLCLIKHRFFTHSLRTLASWYVKVMSRTGTGIIQHLQLKIQQLSYL